ncbi:hypothetical protein SAMN04487964_11248 [Marinobacterium sediminicola]|uniref:DUF6436 domain-containing protein n=2 Tax=Marinobacterium sediminicola TaxID=518898 RepID=A0ABY1S254_9GAMM|nr:hypothetical protein SAMN04487964_11248 [Marinobacterium sediminicola]
MLLSVIFSSRALSVVLVCIWAACMAVAFWWFQLRWYQPLEAHTGDTLFDAGQLALTLQTPAAPIEVIHFFDNTCPCTRFNTPHVRQLMSRYATSEVHFRILVPDNSQQTDARAQFPGAEVRVASAANYPPASPAALIMTSQHGAQYLGPWSPGAVCSTKSGDYVAQVLDQLLTGEQRQQTFQVARGCLCRWSVNPSTASDGVST